MIDEMKMQVRAIMCCLITAILFSACSETITNPFTPGSQLLKHDVVVRKDTLFAISDTTYLQRIANDGLSTYLSQNYVGKAGNLKAYTALRFIIGYARDTINVVSAKLTLRLVSWRGDSSGTFACEVRPINYSWTTTTFSSLLWPLADSSGFFDSAVKGRYSGPVGPDTQYISINLDTAMVRGWWASNTTTNNGIMLIPPASGASIIRGINAFNFDSTQFQPMLTIVAAGTSGVTQDTTTFQTGYGTFVANANPFTISRDRLYSQAGVVYRSKIVFDTLRLPPRGSVINAAELLLVRDPSQTNISKFTVTPQPSVQTLLSTDSTILDPQYSLGSIRANTANTFTFDARREVQLWVNGTRYGLVVRQPDVNDYGALDLYTFYSSKASDPALRPRVIITYTTF